MFNPVSSRVNFPHMEEEVLQLWKREDIFHRTESEREGAPLFTLYEGPPTANGAPGIHHVLARVFKDVICRYKTMKGYRCLRKGGWDTHGLPVELEVERELGLRSKRDIESYGIEEFNRKCRESVFHYVKDWEDMTDRIAYWVDMKNPYVTLDNDYIETGWWIIKQLWDKDLVYQDMKGTPHCPRCVTSLSSHEVAQGYQENTPDPSVFVKFPVEYFTISQALSLDGGQGGVPSPIERGRREEGDPPIYLLAWTTTPWTLPGNTALAVDAGAQYSLVETDGAGGKERLLLATALLDSVMRQPYSVLEAFEGLHLVGVTYNVLYDARTAGVEIRQFGERDQQGLGRVRTLEPTDRITHRVVATDFVSMEEGTGIVHIAPAFGDEDLNAGRQHELAFVQNVDLQGIVTGNYPFAGKFVKDADEDIMADLAQRGLLYHRDVYHHTYPFCWRCSTPLLYYAKTSWYIRTTALKDRLVSGNSEINWNPAYIREGRFGEWLRNNVDWAISRERYWGTPLPIWQCAGCGKQLCVGSKAELEGLASPQQKNLIDGLDMHRPYVDAITIPCPDCEKDMHRVPEVLDAWFDSGAMPFAQWHVPHDTTVDQLRQNGRLPADYICEAVDQTRGWFYSLHALSTLLTNEPCYRNVICLGLILDAQGQKMSKRVGNVVDPWSVINTHGADATRWYLFTASQPGESRRFSDALVSEVVRRFLLTLWNVYSFFTNYASIDKFHPDQVPAGWVPRTELDRWILSELNVLITAVDARLDAYDPTDAGRRIQEFVDGLSNWYVRRSRRRFWKSESDEDKLDAYATLYTCLTTLSRLLAPFTPFVADEMYQNLERSVKGDVPASVHLASFPQASPDLEDETLMKATRLAMRFASLGRSARSKSGIKVRQPLSRVVVGGWPEEDRGYSAIISPQLLDELNVKEFAVEPAPSDMVIAARQALGSQSEGVVELLWGSHENGQTVEHLYYAAMDHGWMVAVDTTLTPELKDEGLARELVHRIQNLRRTAGLEVTDRITTYYQGVEEVQRVMVEFAQYIQQETLSEQVIFGVPPEGSSSDKLKVEGIEILLGVKRL